MPEQGLKDLYVDELKDLYNAENQLVKALPKMAKAASSDELKQGFEEHLEQTRGHVQRLEKIFESLSNEQSTTYDRVLRKVTDCHRSPPCNELRRPRFNNRRTR